MHVSDEDDINYVLLAWYILFICYILLFIQTSSEHSKIR